MGASQLRSAAVGPKGELEIVLNANRGVTLAGPGASWQPLPALPARTATLAAGPGRGVEALAAARATLSVWRLGAGPTAWRLVQSIKVPIPFGSSG